MAPRDSNDFDSPMVDVMQVQTQSSEAAFEELKRTLESKFEEMNLSLSTGINEIKMDLQQQIKTIVVTMPASGVQGGLASRTASALRNTFAPSGVPEPSDPARANWPDHYKTLYESHERLKADYDQLKKDKEQHIRSLEIRMGNVARNSSTVLDVEKRLTASLQKNQTLEDQVTKFRNIILSRGAATTQTIPDSTIVSSFIELRTRIQKIAFKYYSNYPPRLPKIPAKDQDEFFYQFDHLTRSQFAMRVRSKINELLCDGILCRPVFGLDGFASGLELEESLAYFETALSSISKGHEADIAEWRSRTVKCASWLQESSLKRPLRIATLIGDFMEPIEPRRTDKSSDEKIKELNEQLDILCEAAFKLALLLRGCKDVYKCELPALGRVWDQDEADQQDSEPSNDTKAAPRIAVVLSGMLVKYPEHSSGDKLILEKAHVVTRGGG